MAEITPITVARFWSKVAVKVDDRECWEWQGSIGSKGYGTFKLGRATVGTHRVAYLLFNGAFPPKGQLVRHSCDNPRCVNPKHLLAGTPADNSQDMIERGRWRGVEQSGEHNNASKLSSADIEVIKARIAKGETNKAIAADYPVGHAMISLIRRNKSWAVEGAAVPKPYSHLRKAG